MPGPAFGDHFEVDPAGLEVDLADGAAVAVAVGDLEADIFAEHLAGEACLADWLKGWPDSGASMPAKRILTWALAGVRRVRVSPSETPTTRPQTLLAGDAAAGRAASRRRERMEHKSDIKALDLGDKRPKYFEPELSFTSHSLRFPVTI